MHHAELIVGTLEDAKRVLSLGTIEGNPDIRIVEAERLSIDEARSIVRESSLLPVCEAFRTFIVAFKEATLEAQNALLKTLEEPTATTRFFIVVPKEEVLIKTVRSRLMRSDREAQSDKKITAAAEHFLSASYADRLAAIGVRAKDKDTNWMQEVLLGLEITAEKRKDTKLMQAVLLARNYFGSSGASKKMLLEHVALLA